MGDKESKRKLEKEFSEKKPQKNRPSDGPKGRMKEKWHCQISAGIALIFQKWQQQQHQSPFIQIDVIKTSLYYDDLICDEQQMYYTHTHTSRYTLV